MTDHEIPTPGDMMRSLQRVLARAERVRVWNEQMIEVVNVTRQARADGLGVLIRTSHVHNTVDAVPTRHCEAGQALVIDRDRLDADAGLPMACAPISADLFDGPADAALRRRAADHPAVRHPRVWTGVITTMTEGN